MAHAVVALGLCSGIARVLIDLGRLDEDDGRLVKVLEMCDAHLMGNLLEARRMPRMSERCELGKNIQIVALSHAQHALGAVDTFSVPIPPVYDISTFLSLGKTALPTHENYLRGQVGGIK